MFKFIPYPVMPQAQELPGHSQIRMTLDTYSHALPSMQQEAMKKLDALFRDECKNDQQAR